MIIKNPKTGEILEFDNEVDMAQYFCYLLDCDQCILRKYAKNKTCNEWAIDNPHTTARLMGYEVVEDCTETHARNQENAENARVQSEEANVMNDQTAKADAGKLQISLVPTQIIRDIAEVRMYGNAKYGSPDNWKTVDLARYIDALLRHTLAFVDDIDSVDAESGIPHYRHMACNMAFICEMMRWKREQTERSGN